MAQLTDELKKKTKLIQSYMLREQHGRMKPPGKEQEVHRKVNMIMDSIYAPNSTGNITFWTFFWYFHQLWSRFDFGPNFLEQFHKRSIIVKSYKIGRFHRYGGLFHEYTPTQTNFENY